MTSTENSEALPGPALTFMRLPREVQNDIFSHCSQNDLICLSLVSRYFRELAAVQLYRNFHIVFPDEDDPTYDTPIDGLAGGLDTFVTSSYDYGKHLRDLSLDTHSAGDKAELAYKPYLYSVSCGKFMNTLLLLTLRKARALETFRWNIRVELSRPVYKALHEINTISHIHIRLQSGPSLYEAPPSLPYTYSQLGSSTSSPHVQVAAYTPPPPPIFAIPPPPSVFYVPSSTAPPPPLPKPITRMKAVKKSPPSKEPPTLSGFKKLKTLALLDIDTLDIVSELKTCIRHSVGTLSKVKLSFSDALAMQARKPPPDTDPDDSDPDDEFQGVTIPPPGPGYHDDVSGPARAFRAQEERKSQESVLGRIFDVEPFSVKKTPKKPREKGTDTKELGQNPGQDFINSIKVVSAKLVKDAQDSDGVSGSQQELLDLLEAAARKYVSSEEAKARKGQEEVKAEASSSSSAPKPSTGDSKAEVKPAEESSGSDEVHIGLFDLPSPTRTKEGQNDVNPDDIDIEEPEEQLIMEPQDSPSKDTPTNEPTTVSFSEASSSKEPTLVQSDSASFSVTKTTAKSEVAEPQDQRINEYMRTTRGIALRSLSVYLIPVKASVLSRAIDLRVLRHITLLNVGPQAPIWLHLQKENKESPLPLRKIFTDNVSMVFLNFVAQLEELHELFMLERDTKYKPESFAPKTTTTIDQIRRIVLKKHMPNLKRLVIKNIADTAWDLNEKAIMLMCKRGRNLEELACSMGIRAIHTFMQNLSGLVSLRALHIVRLRNDDTCVWVMRETKRFLIDNVSHHPELKLEWVSVDDDDRVERLIRPSNYPKKDKKSKKSKGKQKATVGGGGVASGGTEVFPLLPPPDSWDLSSESEDDEDLQDVKLETMENIHFYDVWGVRIFKKEVVNGRL